MIKIEEKFVNVKEHRSDDKQTLKPSQIVNNLFALSFYYFSTE